ncbi:MAG: DUF370 domain-containing protein [Oscillospiraceae bacterium]|nr:DUF370 domain-containing protein [Oscillospiraceae bacterium]
MYLHLGQDTAVRGDEIIGIFDLDNTTVSPHTRAFLRGREQAGQVVAITDDLPKSFVLCGKGEYRVYLSQVSAATLKKRNR